MKKDNLVFLIVGFAFGALFGIAVLNSFRTEPDVMGNASASAGPGASAPSGPMAPTQVGNAGGAPMANEIRALRKRIEADPNDLAALVRLANMHQDIGDYDNAIGYYESALKVDPDNPDRLTDLGICFRGKGDFERALELFSQAHAVDHNHWQSLFNTVIVAGFDKGDFVRAFEAISELEAHQPGLPQLPDLKAALQKAQAEAGGG